MHAQCFQGYNLKTNTVSLPQVHMRHLKSDTHELCNALGMCYQRERARCRTALQAASLPLPLVRAIRAAERMATKPPRDAFAVLACQAVPGACSRPAQEQNPEQRHRRFMFVVASASPASAACGPRRCPTGAAPLLTQLCAAVSRLVGTAGQAAHVLRVPSQQLKLLPWLVKAASQRRWRNRAQIVSP